MARCKFCNQEISWMKENGRNRPIDGDGGIHSCEQMKKSLKSIKKLDLTEMDPDILKRYTAAINEKAIKK